MKKNILHKLKTKSSAVLFIPAILLFISGCSGTEAFSGNEGSGKGIINITLGEIYNSGDGGTLRSEIISQTSYLPAAKEGGLMAWGTLAPAPVSITRATTQPMQAGKKYYIIFYDEVNSKVEKAVAATAGAAPGDVYLPVGTYSVIAYSVNDDGTKLPTPPSEGDPSPAITADADVDLLYYAIANQVLVRDNPINIQITFSHQYSRILTSTLNTSRLVLDKADVNASIGSHITIMDDMEVTRYDAVLDLVTGALSKGTANNKTISFNSDLPSNTPTSGDAFWIYTGGEPLKVKFPYLEFAYETNNNHQHSDLRIAFASMPMAGFQYNISARLLSWCPAKTTNGDWLLFRCHNLGADESLDPFTYVSTDNAEDSDIKGSLYQWGRKKDGHQLRSSSTSSTLATDNTPNHNMFITPDSYPNDWRSGGGENSRWGNGTANVNPAKAANDPCPPGWKVPSRAQWQSIYKASGTGAPSDATANTWIWSGKGILVGDALFLPAAGYRHTKGSLDGIGSVGNYWSSTGTSINSNYLYFYKTYVAPAVNYARAGGFSVRCVLDQ
ncbi:MAG: FISUMP domain-containing protein [Dysgonamonadaceae bacterium]